MHLQVVQHIPEADSAPEGHHERVGAPGYECLRITAAEMDACVLSQSCSCSDLATELCMHAHLTGTRQLHAAGNGHTLVSRPGSWMTWQCCRSYMAMASWKRCASDSAGRPPSDSSLDDSRPSCPGSCFRSY
jgi:hypothetical protein